jgi:hypothetical protein
MCSNHTETISGEWRECDLKKATVTTILMILLAVTFIFTIFTPYVRAINVEITSVTPADLHGKVGDSVHITGTINTTDGSYRVWFDNILMKEANATGNEIDVIFAVPAIPKGEYNITLQDVKTNNATKLFYVDTACYVEAIMMPEPPQQLQENSTVTIQANVTGGEANTIYYANITVKVPAPAKENYSKVVTLPTTNDGNGSSTLVYPNDFSGASHTNYTGTYTITFNNTYTNTFFVGLTSRTEYHRNQSVNIKAAGYKPSENAKIEVTFGGKTVEPILNANATDGGLIIKNWPVPSNASVGTYTVNITSTLNITKKTPSDTQTFVVPGFDVNITTKNRAEEIVPDVIVRIFENGKSVENGTSDQNGLVRPDSGNLKLEIGTYWCEAYFKDEKVHERWLNVANTTLLDFYCNLTNLKILVIASVDSIEIGVPEAKISLSSDKENQTKTTNINGTMVARSLLPNVSYTLNVSRYGISFNVTTFSSLLVNESAVAWYNITFICPPLILRVNVTKANGEPINSVKVKAQELLGGISYEKYTNDEGIVVFSCAFGKYTLEVYDADGIKLNETTLNLFHHQNVSISCKLYGLTVSIKVVDYFGQPILNANVTLQREGLAPRSQSTQPDGVATFDSITGGNMQIAVYLFEQTQPCVAEEFFVDRSAAIEIKLEKYVVLAGFFVETNHLATALLVAIVVILALSAEFYKKKRSKPKKSSS